MKLLMQRLSLSALCTAALLFASGQSAVAAGDAAAGETKAYTCLGCHGVEHYVNTYPTYKVPRVAGQHETYLVAALQAYRSKTRSHPTMQANAANLSDQDIADISAYFAAKGSDYAGSDSADGGAISTEKGCAACHGPDGNSTTPTFPILAGQYEDYLVQALQQYRSGERQNAIMGASAKLTDAEIAELAAWFSSNESKLQYVK